MPHRIMVLGGSGFIGTVLTKLLRERGHDVSVFDLQPPRDSVRYIAGDVRDRAALVAAVKDHDVLYNLAAAHADNVRPLSLYQETNVDGGRNACIAATEAGIDRIVFTSSVAVYGDSPVELTEDSPHNYINEYGRTKSLAEVEYQKWAAENPARSLTIVRPSVVFGPRNRGNVFNLLQQIASGRFVMVGAGTNRKSMAYVDNVAGFLEFALRFGPGTTLTNYADKPDFDMNELVSLVRSSLGKNPKPGLRISPAVAAALGAAADTLSAIARRPLPVSSVRIQKFQANTQVAANRVRELGYTPVVPLREGLQRTIASEFVAKAA